MKAIRSWVKNLQVHVTRWVSESCQIFKQRISDLSLRGVTLPRMKGQGPARDCNTRGRDFSLLPPTSGQPLLALSSTKGTNVSKGWDSLAICLPTVRETLSHTAEEEWVLQFRSECPSKINCWRLDSNSVLLGGDRNSKRWCWLQTTVSILKGDYGKVAPFLFHSMHRQPWSDVLLNCCAMSLQAPVQQDNWTQTRTLETLGQTLALHIMRDNMERFLERSHLFLK